MNEQGQSTAIAIYDRVEPMEFIEKIGKVFAMTGAGGCKTEADGKLMALACISKGQTIFDLARRYHLMDGKLVTKAEAMLADFKRRGGKVMWIKNGCDGREAKLELTLDDVTADYEFSIETAQKAGYVKPKSNWEKRPDQMLRSRCITDLMRMQWPEISDGDYSEDEIADLEVVSSAPSSSSAAKPSRTKAETEKRRAELQAEANGSQAAESTQPTAANVATEAVVDVVAEPATSQPQTEQPPFDVGDASEADIPSGADAAFTAELLEIESLVDQLRQIHESWTNEAIIRKYNSILQASATKLDDFTGEQRQAILRGLRAVLEKAKGTSST